MEVIQELLIEIEYSGEGILLSQKLSDFFNCHRDKNRVAIFAMPLTHGIQHGPVIQYSPYHAFIFLSPPSPGLKIQPVIFSSTRSGAQPHFSETITGRLQAMASFTASPQLSPDP